MKIDLKEQQYLAHNILIYHLNLKDFPIERLQQGDTPISYSLETIQGKIVQIIVDKDLKFQIKGKKTKHSPLELYRLIYGIGNKEAQQIAYSLESSLYGAFTVMPDLLPKDSSSLPSEYSPFGFTHTYQGISVEWIGFQHKLRVHSLSPNGYSVATKDINLKSGQIRWETQGVFRLHPLLWKSDTPDYVIVTDTPLEADYLLAKGIPAFSLPSEGELEYYGYSQLLKGKTVYLCCSKYGANFSFSYYPLSSLLLKDQIEVFVIHPSRAFDYESIPNWFHNENKEALLPHLSRHAERLQPSMIPSRASYNELTETQVLQRIHLAQDYQNQSLTYGMSSGDVAISKPIRSFNQTDLTKFEGVVPYLDEDLPESGLTPFVLEKIKQNDYLPPEKTFAYMRRFIKRFIYFKDETYFDILCSWILTTYLFRVFKAYPYIHLSGLRGSGKSTILELVAQLAFNGFFQTKATISTSVERAHTHSSTLCIDEFEDYSGRRQSHDELSKFLNSGYNYMGSFTKRVGKSSTTFFTYCPKMFGGTGDIGIDTLKSRTIQMKTFKKPSNVEKEQFLDFKKSTMDDIALLKTSMYALGLNHASEIYALSLNNYSEVKLPVSKKKLDNRQLELARPLLTLAHFLQDDELYQSLLNGLDTCWNPIKSFKNKRELELHTILSNYFEQAEKLVPKEEVPEFDLYDAIKLLDHPEIRKFTEKENLGKQQFNALINDTFGIERTDDIYVPSYKKNPSCYKVPNAFLE